MYFQLYDYETEEILGTVKVLNPEKPIDVHESWVEFNQLGEHELDGTSIQDFVKWNNENRVCQIEEIFLDFVQP